MKKRFYFVILQVLCFSLFLVAQNDTTIYKIVEEMPRFPGCEGLDTTITVKNKCAESVLINVVNSNIRYPEEARANGVEGMVVTSFVVEKDGFISDPVVIRDIGGGCGDEALRVLNGLNDALKQENLQWTPGKKGGQPVRTQFTLPIRFKLKEPDDFVMIGRDSVYIMVDDSLQYKGGYAAFETYLSKNLKYPLAWEDSCKVGMMDVKLLVRPDGTTKVLDVTDLSNLGFDFQFEAIEVSNASYGNWTPATRKGRKVPSSIDYSVFFTPSGKQCESRVNDYNTANQLADEGWRIYNEGNFEEGIAKLTAAIELFPDNANFLYLRGKAYLEKEMNAEACADFTLVKDILPMGIINSILPIICR